MCRKIFSAIISCVIIFNTVFCFSFVNAKEINTVPNILYEDESKRGAFEKHFVTSDGSYLATSFPEQVCIKDSNDEWQLIDNTLKKLMADILQPTVIIQSLFLKNMVKTVL